MIFGGTIKERKVWESSEKKERDRGMEEEDSISIQGPKVNLGRTAAVHQFSGCESR
jgi:hypothetical protein